MASSTIPRGRPTTAGAGGACPGGQNEGSCAQAPVETGGGNAPVTGIASEPAVTTGQVPPPPIGPPQVSPVNSENPAGNSVVSPNASVNLPQTGATSLATPTAGPGVVAPSSVDGSSATKGGSNLSGGAVAGVAIAALIIGAGLAFAAAFFFFKRRNKTRDGAVGYNNNYTDSSPELVMMQKSAGRNSPYVQVSQTPLPPPVTIPAPAPAAVQQPPKDVIASILPAAAHDSEIQGRISALFGQIHRHIDTYYRDVHASITPSMEPELARFGAKDVNMAELLQDCSSPTTALKHALAVYVLGITGPKSGDEGETLFPEELKGARSQNNSGLDSNLSTAQTLHRRLSVYLYTTASASSPTSPRRRSWSFQGDIREAAEHFSLTFFPWANPGSDDQEKEDDLTRVISDALETRVWLFGQPAEYEFRWDGVGTRGVVVSPELVKADRLGGRGRVLVESGVAGL
ncbi:hypothetical protein CC86DRAFT_285141 [Ophiobolus disseminans]|uniref:Uncharacterized protein n=1 Tax=Ophiobolus disseminans TaxID=1469910 RepID=A0A6A7AA31_9PLEO|nr:hypothetical protein CC86DRAFT_285141 [Ophiobolus disseminans]